MRSQRALGRLLVLVVAVSGIDAAPMLSTSVVVPNGVSYTEQNASDNLVHSLFFGTAAIAMAQSDYGILRNYVYSNIGESIPGYESQAATHFLDGLNVTSPVSGRLAVEILIDGQVTFMETPVSGLNGQTFTSQWALHGINIGITDSCSAFLPVFPTTCSLTLPVSAGLNLFNFTGEIRTLTLGRASATEMDLFNTGRVLSMLVLDDNGNRVSASIRSDSGTVYPSGVPEPGTFFLASAALGIALVVRASSRGRSFRTSRCD